MRVESIARDTGTEEEGKLIERRRLGIEVTPERSFAESGLSTLLSSSRSSISRTVSSIPRISPIASSSAILSASPPALKSSIVIAASATTARVFVRTAVLAGVATTAIGSTRTNVVLKAVAEFRRVDATRSFDGSVVVPRAGGRRRRKGGEVTEKHRGVTCRVS